MSLFGGKKENNEVKKTPQNSIDNPVKKTKFIIADRGVKRSYNDITEERNKWRRFAYISLIIAFIGIANFIMPLVGLKGKYFIVPQNSKPLMLTQEKTIPLTNTRLSLFMESAIPATLGLNFATVENDLKKIKIYYSDEAYDNTMDEMKRSNTIEVIEQTKSVTTLSPTSTVVKYDLYGDKGADVVKSFLKTTIKGNNIRKEEIVVTARVYNVPPDDRYPWGLLIHTFSVERLDEKY